MCFSALLPIMTSNTLSDILLEKVFVTVPDTGIISLFLSFLSTIF